MAEISEELDDHELCVELALRAGQLLVGLRDELAGEDQTVIKDRGDTQSHKYLMAELTRHRSQDAVLSEEATSEQLANSTRLESERVWIIDPLDGTREYGEGRSDWAVHVALAQNGVPIAAAVSLPAQGEVFSTAKPTKIVEATRFKNSDRPLKVVTSRTRQVPICDALVQHWGAERVAMGSAGAKAMAVVKGDVDIYAHTGGQYEWDSCAPVAVAAAAGLHTSRIDGSPFRYNQPDPYMPDLLICRPELAEEALRIAKEITS